MRFGHQLGATYRDGGRWLVPIFLLIAVLAPTACVLWFMNVAVNNQRDASRRKLSEAYRGQLTLLRERAESYWEKRAGELERESRDGTAAEIFARLVERGLADSAVCLTRDGAPEYPSVTLPMAADSVDERGDWRVAASLESQRQFSVAAEAYAAIARAEPNVSVVARAAEAQIRCLSRGGDKSAAIRAVETHFATGRLLRGVDLEGRLIAADEHLLAIHLMDRTDRRYDAAVRRLAALLNDYAGLPLPAPQRLFLMDEMRALPMKPDFSTYSAERLAAEFLQAGRLRPGEQILEPGGVPDTWTLSPPGGRILALYRTATVAAAMRGLSNGLNVSVVATPPGTAPPRSTQASPAEWMPAGKMLPGWTISLSPVGSEPFDDPSRRQTMSYLWIGFLAIGVVTATALAAGQAFRRQWQLARLKTDLVAAVSHEIKTPLSSMGLLVDALLEEAELDMRKTREYLEMIARENLRLSRLIENFLTFSRLERNRRTLQLRATQPESVIQAALEAAQERFQAPGCWLEVSVSPGLPAVRADEDALVTVLLNLLDNAYKYTPGEKRIGLRAFRAEGSVVFAVQDNGIGIAARERKRIFRRFYQVDRRLAREEGGCGLGLSIVEFIVKAHGGAVRLKSQPGEGSTFSVVLPCAGAMRGATA